MPIAGLALGFLTALAGSAAAPQSADLYKRGVDYMAAGNFADAYCLWKPLAQQGYPEAQYSIGWMYANGYGLAMDEKQALDWWKRAAEHGHADAQFAVAMAYMYGDGVKQDRGKAAQWLIKAARAGVDDAQVILLDMAGRGVEDAEKAIAGLLKGKDWKVLGNAAKVSADRANVRSGPGTNHDVVSTLEKGARLLVLTRNGDWLRVGVIGSGELVWVFAPLVTLPADSG
ncbi:MAG: SEL1-like repeat protein [Zoogloeaceae bacterium]|nr:SEL1-like repeat protein [Zoogloeaceae bacterium]